ncbi:MAG: family 16 glycosylhydrolase [Anaerolineaceae bacterium]|nr:family 16 glycosylhydrolase [Anaerolineaceae bacterium]
MLIGIMILSTGACTKVTLTPPSILPTPPSGSSWELIPVLSDEFNGPVLDRHKWLDYHPYWSGRTPSQFDVKNVSVSGGLLRLKNTTDVTNLNEVANPEEDNWVKAAIITSVKPIAMYGYYEARVKASGISMTSSFWLQGKYSEIDVVEQIGAPAKQPGKSRLMLINTHFYPGGWENDKKTPREIPMTIGAAEDFHVYGVWWKDKDTAWLYHNGELVTEIQLGGEFLEPMYLFLDTEVFIWEGLPAVEDLKDDQRSLAVAFLLVHFAASFPRGARSGW